jgi:hypothetical protein
MRFVRETGFLPSLQAVTKFSRKNPVSGPLPLHLILTREGGFCLCRRGFNRRVFLQPNLPLATELNPFSR